jgi:hypothetical protein
MPGSRCGCSTSICRGSPVPPRTATTPWGPRGPSSMPIGVSWSGRPRRRRCRRTPAGGDDRGRRRGADRAALARRAGLPDGQ